MSGGKKKGGEQSPPNSEIDTIIEIFRSEAKLELSPRDVATLPYLLSLIRAHPRDFLDSPDANDARKAMQLLNDLLPGLIEQAKAKAKKEAAAGRSTWLDRYAEEGRKVLDALAPFALDRRDVRSWWHRWAKILSVDVRLIFKRAGGKAGFSHETSPGVRVLIKILALAGVSVSSEQVIEALKPKRKKRGENNAKVPRSLC